MTCSIITIECVMITRLTLNAVGADVIAGVFSSGKKPNISSTFEKTNTYCENKQHKPKPTCYNHEQKAFSFLLVSHITTMLRTLRAHEMTLLQLQTEGYKIEVTRTNCIECGQRLNTICTKTDNRVSKLSEENVASSLP